MHLTTAARAASAVTTLTLALLRPGQVLPKPGSALLAWRMNLPRCSISTHTTPVL